MPAETGHPVFLSPDDPNIKVWRYLDFTKYVSLLETRSLYFSRSDRLGDPFEGSISRANPRLRPLVYKDSPIPSTEFERMAKRYKWNRQWVFLNCWHINEHESAAMWKLYAKSNEAVALQSTFSRLHSCLPKKVYLGVVQYIDYDKDWMAEGNLFYPFVHKQKSFEHEREVRAVINTSSFNKDGVEVPIPEGMKNDELGREVRVELETLIENIYVAPTAPDWFGELVERVSRKYGLEKPVIRSVLDQKPVY